MVLHIPSVKYNKYYLFHLNQLEIYVLHYLNNYHLQYSELKSTKILLNHYKYDFKNTSQGMLSNMDCVLYRRQTENSFSSNYLPIPETYRLIENEEGL